MRPPTAALFLLIVATSVARAMPRLQAPKYPVTRVTGEAPRWRLDSLGTLSDSGVGFRDVKGVLIDPRGGVLVLDRKVPAIYRFDDDGRLRGVIGRTGSGPKEYRSPNAIGWADGDLMVFDPANGRIVRWNPAGEWMAQWIHSRVSGTVPMYSAGPSSVWVLGFENGVDGKVKRVFIRFPATGQGDTIRPAAAPPRTNNGLDCQYKDTVSGFSRPFSEPVFAIRPTPAGTFVELSGTEYRVALKSTATDTVRVLEHVVAPLPITDREWDDSTAEYRKYKSGHPLATCEGSMARPKGKASVLDLITDDRGRIWIERAMPNGTQMEIWEGERLVGMVPGVNRLLRAVNGIDIRGDRMVVTRANDDGGTVAVVYRIVPRR